MLRQTLSSYKPTEKDTDTEVLEKKAACVRALISLIMHLMVSMGYYTIIPVRWQNVMRLYISLCHLVQMGA